MHELRTIHSPRACAKLHGPLKVFTKISHLLLNVQGMLLSLKSDYTMFGVRISCPLTTMFPSYHHDYQYPVAMQLNRYPREFQTLEYIPNAKKDGTTSDVPRPVTSRMCSIDNTQWWNLEAAQLGSLNLKHGRRYLVLSARVARRSDCFHALI
ncbi:hypothetical protein DEU56DRAFT_761658 [Suillus clintonianus]|uniref:uncharacterized protein n=1 Tax=Suillus clintonianus TaxID=1904413 RepID=UPI001B8819B7|nr:uncharacterized protein DEU56DRAFT_761658 [Suillus clintonianus]KAG2115525.1 hypothetical protein DEU56DRAFT_761658 [Suillus clintonianus]